MADGHAHEVHGFPGRAFGLAGMHPGVLVADVGHFEEVLVEPGGLESLSEQGLMGSGRTGGHDDAVQPLLGNALLR